MIPQKSILTITLNPALDLSTSIDAVVPSEKLRCAQPLAEPGGGGLNVSRAIAALGGRSLALVALAGTTGARLADLLTQESIDYIAISAPGETRQSMTISETTTGRHYRFLLPGPNWDEVAQARVFARLADLVRPGGIAIISGSQPPGVPNDFVSTMAKSLAGMQVVIDTSGTALTCAVEDPIPGLALLRMNSSEAEEIAGRALPERIDTADFASELVARGVAERVIIARGGDGSVMAEAGRRLWCCPSPHAVVSRVGAGDSSVAGWTLGMARDLPVEVALRMAVAAASSAVAAPGTELCNLADVEALMPRCTEGAL